MRVEPSRMGSVPLEKRPQREDTVSEKIMNWEVGSHQTLDLLTL